MLLYIIREIYNNYLHKTINIIKNEMVMPGLSTGQVDGAIKVSSLEEMQAPAGMFAPIRDAFRELGE